MRGSHPHPFTKRALHHGVRIRCKRPTSSLLVLTAGRFALLRAVAMTSATSCLTASSRVASRVIEPPLTAEHEHDRAVRRGLATNVQRACNDRRG